MNLEDIRNMAKQDLGMDKTELDTESMKTPQLHNKYLIMYSDEKCNRTSMFLKRISGYITQVK